MIKENLFLGKLEANYPNFVSRLSKTLVANKIKLFPFHYDKVTIFRVELDQKQKTLHDN